MEVDFLLIGQGLAGSVLSYRLIRSGYQVHLIDRDEDWTSSKVAAGLYNPITGRRMVKTWQADVLFEEIEPFYREWERFLNTRFLYPSGIYRPFLSFEEQNEWVAKSADPQFDAYLEKVHCQPKYLSLQNDFGGLLIKRSGYVDIKKLLDHYLKWLRSEGKITLGLFSESDLNEKNGSWFYKEIKAKKIIFANGLEAGSNSFFGALPFAPVKGEILTVQHDETYEEIINRGIFRIDKGNGLARVGSNYEKNELSKEPTQKAKKELMEKIDQLFLNPDIEVIDQHAGIRPATEDRRPFLGKHPSFDNVFIFGGFGAKGVSLAPYFSIEMMKLLTLNEEPQKEVNINRFFKYI